MNIEKAIEVAKIGREIWGGCFNINYNDIIAILEALKEPECKYSVKDAFIKECEKTDHVWTENGECAGCPAVKPAKPDESVEEAVKKFLLENEGTVFACAKDCIACGCSSGYWTLASNLSNHIANIIRQHKDERLIKVWRKYPNGLVPLDEQLQALHDLYCAVDDYCTGRE